MCVCVRSGRRGGYARVVGREGGEEGVVAVVVVIVGLLPGLKGQIVWGGGDGRGGEGWGKRGRERESRDVMHRFLNLGKGDWRGGREGVI